MPNVALRRPKLWLLKAVLAILFAQWLCGPMLVALADEPQPDPAGIATGDKIQRRRTRAATPSSSPSRPTRPPPTTPTKKKAFDEYQAQAAKEPLAVKLADTVGHVRIATNFAWTLITGYLVLFMQAGFALLTCGLVRKKNAGHLMMLNFAAYVFAFLAYYAVGYAFQFGGVGDQRRARQSRRHADAEPFLIGERPVGLPGRQGILPERSRLRRRQQRADAVRSRVHGDRRLHHRRRDLRAHHLLGLHPVRALRGRDPVPDLRLLGLGRRLAVAARQRPWASATATWISPVRPWFTPSADSARWRWRSSSVRGSASTDPTASRELSRRTTSCSS